MKELVINSTKFGKHIVLYDEGDHELISGFKWYVIKHHTGRFYCTSIAIPRKNIKTVLMHRLIMNAPLGQIIDHANGNSLDNRKHNLRFATSSQNQANRKIHRNNTTGFKGVCYNKRSKSFVVSSGNNHIGYFKNKIDAAIAYNKYAQENFGEFANLNQIPIC